MPGNVADAMIQLLAAAGARTVYGVSGDAVFPLLDALSRQDMLKYYSITNEAWAAFMAAYEAMLSGRPAVCIATSGPGTANLVNGLAEACFCRVPVVAVTGQVETKKIGTNAKQFFHQRDLIKTFAEMSEIIVNPEALVPVVTSALNTAVSRRTVVHLSVPSDIFLMPCEVKGNPVITGKGSVIGCGQPGEMEKAVNLLRKSICPMLLLGSRDRRTGKEALRLAEKAGAPVVVAQQTRGVIPEDHPYVLGGIGEGYLPDILNRLDLTLIIGEASYELKYLPPETPVIQVAEEPGLLYTERVSAGLTGNPEAITVAFMERICSGNSRRAGFNLAWTEEIRREKENRQEMLREDQSLAGTPVHPARLIAAINRVVAEDAVITLDIGSFNHWFERGFTASGQTVLVSGRWRSMGSGLPAAIAAKLAAPGRQVLALVGDGGLLMSMGELLTAVRYNLPITIVVMTNQGYILEKQKMMSQGLTPFGNELAVPDFAGFAESCGAIGFRVRTPEEVEPVLREALDCGRPALVDVETGDVLLPHL
ncbi:MAG: hypothetical protein CVU89_07025 [Firmicutes bacterium HGW-Firmicutes-14]|nr:MAG: hypothetical protein CVU89_07025 [Firmicutes bacterium HGW-Firmicutes-14]